MGKHLKRALEGMPSQVLVDDKVSGSPICNPMLLHPWDCCQQKDPFIWKEMRPAT